MTKYILAISGNDIFSGGGLHADLTTYTVNGLHGFVAITCLTALTDKGFEIIPVDNQVFTQQLNSLKKVEFSAIKIGLLPDVSVAKQTLSFVKEHENIPVILDPVLVCKEDHDIEVSALRDELIQFFPYVSIITPNLVEAEILSQISIQNLDDMKLAAHKLYDLGAKHVVIKGGDRLKNNKATDVYYDGKDFTVLTSELLDNNNIGAGCTFASSIASYLALGNSTLASVDKAKDFVHKAIQQSDQYGVKQNFK